MLAKLSLVVFATIASSSVFASEIECNQPGAQGYKFTATRGLPGTPQTATLKVPGERARRKMTCAIPAVSLPRPGRVGGDQTRPVMFCGEDGDYGYSVRVRSGGHLGMTANVMFTGKFDTTSSAVTMMRCESK